MKVKIALLSLCCTGCLFADVVEHIGSYAGWDTAVWTPVSGLNDGDDGLTKNYLDFVGDSSDPGAYRADNGDYLFFRIRVNTATVDAGTFSDAMLILIDVENYLYGSGFGSDAPNTPDYAFAWDSNQIEQNHGLEMSCRDIVGTTWAGSQMEDLDGSNGSKGVEDINGDGRTTDGYIRSVDGQSTTSFGDTSFIDFAVSWAYLEAHTDLEKGQTWNIALAAIDNATDHGALRYDIAGGASPTDSITTGWAVVPEPATISLIAVAGLSGLVMRRLYDRRQAAASSDLC